MNIISQIMNSGTAGNLYLGSPGKSEKGSTRFVGKPPVQNYDTHTSSDSSCPEIFWFCCVLPFECVRLLFCCCRSC